MEFLSPSSPTFIVAIFSLILFFFTYSSLQRTRNPNKKQLVPEPSGAWPLIGHLPILGNLPHKTLSTIADKYGPLFGIRLGVHPALVVSSWEMAKQCLSTNDMAFSSRPKAIATEVMAYDYAMFGFSPYGPYWRQVRKIATLELLSNHRLELLKNIRESEVNQSIKEIYKLCSDEGVVVDMKRWFGDVTLNVVVRMVAGKRHTGDSGSEDEWDKCRKAIRVFFDLMGKFVVADALPYLRWLDLGGYEKKMKKTAMELDSVMQGWLEEHRQRSESGDVKAAEQDFMGVMLSILESDENREILSHDADTVNKATCQALILGGTDTTTATLTWTLALLLKNRHTLQKAQEELDFHVGKERNVNSSDMKNLVYIQAVIKESMRLYPAAPLLPPRVSAEDCEVGGYHIPAGTRLLVNIWKIQRDPRVWSNPCEFQPERFLTSHKDIDFRGQSFEFIPFGSGRRVCPGISFALQSVQFTLASLLHGFEITTPTDEPIDMTERSGLTSIKATPLGVLLTPRLSSGVYE